MDEYRRECAKQIGGGGFNCRCCGPFGRGAAEEKRKMHRLARHRLKASDKRAFERGETP